MSQHPAFPCAQLSREVTCAVGCTALRSKLTRLDVLRSHHGALGVPCGPVFILCHPYELPLRFLRDMNIVITTPFCLCRFSGLSSNEEWCSGGDYVIYCLVAQIDGRYHIGLLKKVGLLSRSSMYETLEASFCLFIPHAIAP